MGSIISIPENVIQVGGRRKNLFSAAPSTKFRFSDPITQYPNGNLQDHTPWTYTFATCATLIGFVNSGGFLMQGDTVNNDWSAIMVGSAPIKRRWLLQAQFTALGSNLPFRGGFGVVSSTSLSSFTLSSWFGPCVRRIVTAGAINVTAGGFTQGPCVTADTNTVAASATLNDTYRMIITPLGATTYTVQWFVNGVLALTTTENGGAGSVGLRPAFACSGFAGGSGAMKFNNVFCKEL